MKKLLLLLTLAVFAFESNAQESRPVCPPGYDHVGGGFTIDLFNFHKPRTNCTRQFGICMQTSPFITCETWPGIRIRIYITDYRSTNYVAIKNDTATLYLPLALKTHEEFAGEDMSLFHVERRTVSFKMADGSWEGFLKEGAYPVEETATALVVRIPIE